MNLDLAERIGGRANDSPLTPLGQQQARALGAHLAHPPVASEALKIFSSTSKRSVDTAIIALEAMGAATTDHIVFSEELLEQDMGEWEGALRTECYTAENLKLIEGDTHNFRAPGGESQLDVEERMMQYLRDTVLPVTSTEHPSIVFGHGMAVKTVLRHILNSDARMTRKIALGNTAITEIGYVPEGAAPKMLQRGWHILRVNDTAHLRKQ